jgi:hypothetical protein
MPASARNLNRHAGEAKKLAQEGDVAPKRTSGVPSANSIAGLFDLGTGQQ